MKRLKEQKSGLMTTDEVAEYLRISRASVYRLVKGKSIPVSRIGRQLRFRRDALDSWLSKKESEILESEKGVSLITSKDEES